MMSTKRTLFSPMQMALVAMCGSLASFLAVRHTAGEWIFARAHTLLEYDYGNAIAALVAVAGYLVDHWASRNNARIEKQMERAEAQSHQLLVPVTTQWQSLLSSLTNFIDKHAGEIMSRSGDEYREALAKYQLMNNNFAGIPHVEMSPTHLNNPTSFAMVMEILFCTEDGKTRTTRVSSKRELPLIIHNEIKNCDRDSMLWNSYETFVRHSFVPAVEKIADLIDEHGHLMEPVPSSRMKEMFGTEGNGYGQKWTVAPRMWFYSYFLAYTRSWRELMSMWDNGLLDNIRPSVDFLVGIMWFNLEAQTIVAQVEQSLIGTSQMHGHRR